MDAPARTEWHLIDHVIRLSREVSALAQRQEATEEELTETIAIIHRLERELERIRTRRVGLLKVYRTEIGIALGLAAVWSGILTADELKALVMGSMLP